MHGFGASLHTWQPWAEVLSRDLRVIRIDLPGSGLSSPDPTDNYSDRRTLEPMVALLDQLKIERKSVIGNSIDGRIAWTFAAIHPQRVNQLVLVAPVLQDPVPLLKRITAPTLLLWGRQDGMIPLANSADYAAAIPNNKLVILDDLGHLPHEEAPERWLIPVRSFLLQP